MRIVIAGPGALGCFLAHFLKRAEVWLLDHDPKRAEQIKTQAISAQGVGGKWQTKVSISSRAADMGPADLLILCVKAYDTKEALLHAKEVIQPQTLVLTLHNGLGPLEMISEIVDERNILVGVTHHAVHFEGEGKLIHSSCGETIIGNPQGFIPAQIRELRELFNECGLVTKISRNIKGVLWSRLIIQAGTGAIGALTHLKNGDLMKFEGSADLIRAAVTEAVKVAKRARIKLIYDDPLAKVEAVLESTAGDISSLSRDILAREKTEVDFINGVIVRLGRSYGIPTPANQYLLQLIKTIESSYELTVNTDSPQGIR